MPEGIVEGVLGIESDGDSGGYDHMPELMGDDRADCREAAPRIRGDLLLTGADETPVSAAPRHERHAIDDRNLRILGARAETNKQSQSENDSLHMTNSLASR